MKKLALGMLITLFISIGTPAIAKDQDMGKFTCKELLASKDDIPFIMFWVDGYMSSQSENLLLSAEWMQTLTEHYISHCKAYPNDTILDTMRALPSN